MDIEQVKKLAYLARLEVSEDELATLAVEMGSIVAFVDEIQKVQIPANEARDFARVNIFRDDIVTPIIANHDLVETAPMHQDHFVKVPKVIGE